MKARYAVFLFVCIFRCNYDKLNQKYFHLLATVSTWPLGLKNEKEGIEKG